MEILIKASQLILSLSILIVLHELGHFIPAKLFKTRVEKFYLFFDPWFSIFKVKKGDTEYGMGWLPLGGYVKISGMIDESMDKEQMAEEPKPWEFRSKPAWQRLIIMVGGVTVNFLLAIFIYIMMLSIMGESYLPAENAKYGIYPDSIAREIGMQPGDKIFAVEGRKIDDLTGAYKDMVIREAQSISVMRDGQLVDLEIPGESFQKIMNLKDQQWLVKQVRIPFIVEKFVEGSPAKKAGMLPGDSIAGVNGREAPFFQEFRNELEQYKGQEITVHAYRNGERKDFAFVLPETGLMGVFPVSDINRFFEVSEIDYSFFEAIPAGARMAVTQFEDYIRSLKLLASPNVKASESVGGFITIANAFSPEWDWVRFWSFTAFLSIILAIMNILPIPALDGGHVMFLLYEVITGRKPNEKFLEYAQYVGMILLLSLLIFANGNDILRLFR